MATTTMNGLRKTFIQGDTSIAKYRIVKLGTNANEVVASTANTDVMFGVSDESADSTSGNPVGVVLNGTATVVIGSATSKGAYITATTGGKGVATTTNLKKVIGILLETTTENDQPAEVLLCPHQMSV